MAESPSSTWAAPVPQASSKASSKGNCLDASEISFTDEYSCVKKVLCFFQGRLVLQHGLCRRRRRACASSLGGDRLPRAIGGPGTSLADCSASDAVGDGGESATSDSSASDAVGGESATADCSASDAVGQGGHR